MQFQVSRHWMMMNNVDVAYYNVDTNDKDEDDDSLYPIFGTNEWLVKPGGQDPEPEQVTVEPGYGKDCFPPIDSLTEAPSLSPTTAPSFSPTDYCECFCVNGPPYNGTYCSLPFTLNDRYTYLDGKTGYQIKFIPKGVFVTDMWTIR